MFNYDQGLGLGKWLYWFIGVMAVYGLLTMFPENKIAAGAAGVFAVVGIAIARHQIAKGRREK